MEGVGTEAILWPGRGPASRAAWSFGPSSGALWRRRLGEGYCRIQGDRRLPGEQRFRIVARGRRPSPPPGSAGAGVSAPAVQAAARLLGPEMPAAQSLAVPRSAGRRPCDTISSRAAALGRRKESPLGLEPAGAGPARTGRGMTRRPPP